MSAASNYLEELILNHIFRTSSFTKPTTLAIALYTATPGETGGGTEVSNANAYARVDMGAPIDGDWSDPSAGTQGETDNVADITFPQATGSWGTVTHVGIHDSATWGGGNLLFYGALTTPKPIDSGDTFKFSAGDLNISLT